MACLVCLYPQVACLRSVLIIPSFPPLPPSLPLSLPFLQSADVEKVEEQVLHLRSQVVVELESRAARNQQRLTQLQAELALEREEHEGASKAILECIMGALHALADHKEEVKRRLGT